MIREKARLFVLSNNRALAMLSEKKIHRKKIIEAMSMSRKSRVVCLHAAEFGLERGLVSAFYLE